LVNKGLQKHHKVLDFGCGSGRLGIPLIAFSDKGCYFGIESHANSLRAFAEHEIPNADLNAKVPRLLLDRDFNFNHFKIKFDMVVETSVTQHIHDDALIKKAYSNIAKVLEKDGIYIVSPRLRLSKVELETLGLRHLEDSVSHFKSFENSPYEAKTYWSSYVKV